MRHYTHLSLEERAMIGLYYNKGLSLGEISKEVGRDKSTLSRELRRNSNQQTYVATTACKRYLSRRQKPSRLDQDEILKTYVTDRLREGLSPEIISLRLKRFGHLEGVAYVNPESIYQWLYRPPQKKEKLHKLLVRGHGNRGHRKRVHGSKIKGRVSIHERPEAAKDRQEIGHWEVDLMAFLRNSQHMLVIHERKTRYTAAIKLANKTAAETLKALLSFFQGLPEDLLKTITFDNGTEFAYHQNLSDILKVPTYFCDVYASWQK
jgi:IS30 family transposase